ncbi:hypothetical protein GCM10010448_23720 [Streptomyces glomeratus]|uniref:Uncharacterized protein n=2 Tax=Streptomyces glomeratus TaxID=284452 RepID=A0ABP6LHB8_9ACTN
MLSPPEPEPERSVEPGFPRAAVAATRDQVVRRSAPFGTGPHEGRDRCRAPRYAERTRWAKCSRNAPATMPVGTATMPLGTGVRVPTPHGQDRTMKHPHLPTTEAAVTAIHEIAREFGLEFAVTHDIGADQTSRRTAAGAFTVLDPDGSLPHEAFVELGGSPAVTVRLFPEDDAKVTVDDVDFEDLPRDSVPAFLRSVYGGLARVKGRAFPPGHWLIVPLPGDETYRELIPHTTLTPWLARNARA